MNQRTIQRDIKIEGVGIHLNKNIQVVIKKADLDNGICFYKVSRNHKIKIELNSYNVINTQLASVIGVTDDKNIVHKISTIEHLLSVISAYQIDNLNIYVYGDEIPILDGSAIEFVKKIDEAKILEQNRPKEYMKIKKIVKVQDGDSFVSLEPALNFSFDVEIDFNHKKIGKQSYSYTLSTESFKKQIAIARTFGFVSDMKKLQKNGLALGASLDNGIGLSNDEIVNKDGLRVDEEFVKHKLLDAIGDIRILHGNIIGRYSSYKAGHKLNSELRLKVLSSKNNYHNFS